MNASERRSCPALLIAAPDSGQGKTTVVASLARLHARQGRRVRVFTCGPDFLDLGWLALASGAPVHSLYLWMTGERDCAARLWQAAGEADLARTSRPGSGEVVDQGEAMDACGAMRATYLHAWFGSSPRTTAALFTATGANA